jgi:N-acetylglutamate synthase-like GNAT family acetyltransferase
MIIKLLESNITDETIYKINRFKEMYIGRHRNIPQFNWEYKDIPYQALFIIMENENNLIGTQALLPNYLIVNSEKIYSAKSEETLLHPDCRGMGLFKKIYDYTLRLAQIQNINIIWGFTNAIKPFSNIGFTICEPLSMFMYTMNINEIYKKMCNEQFKGTKYKILLKIKYIGLLYMRSVAIISEHRNNNTNKGEYKINEVRHFNEDTDNLFDNFKKNYPELITLCRNHNYMNWRIIKNPYYNKKVLLLEVKKELVGYVAFSYKNINDALVIEDIIILKDHSEKGLHYLLTEVIKIAKDIKINKIQYEMVICNNLYSRNIVKIMKQIGFVALPKYKSMKMIIKIVNKNNITDNISKIDRWYINTLFKEGTN